MDEFSNAKAAMTMNGFFNSSLVQTDPEVAGAINDELKRQQDQIEMIASENIVSTSVMEAQGSILTNKYAEGYSGRRYYGGCEHVDVIETLAIERAKSFSTVILLTQPHSGAQANQAVFLVCLNLVIQFLECHWQLVASNAWGGRIFQENGLTLFNMGLMKLRLRLILRPYKSWQENTDRS